ncbi:malonyl CoA-acyl carrier protein transacylase [Longimycelium tulufanense]|uniref:Malonyl CoA-acyl carrier protein transacylase n=1 Tax=Longimycelium tulufanense TaxID=907463 RepID=A0A8J3FU14_9PSEU|nr:ACP S-malonyltransferase [Longimycelium tulufanense]GGM46338.1 malonyl CoA-acyl carrier protein transacylase [Longimycelium tulufanense]
MSEPSSGGPAWVFPDQGSQFPGMGRELDRSEPTLGLLARAGEVTGLPVAELMRSADAATPTDPEVGQVLVFVWSCAMAARLGVRGCRPALVAGHSLGEYSALVACGSLDIDTALRLVSSRGKAMARATRRHPGAMAAVVGLPPDVVLKLCGEQDGETVVVAHFNSPRHIVVSGEASAVRAVATAARDSGALWVRLFSGGSAHHSPLMAEAEAELARELATVRLRPPGVPLVSSVTGQVVSDVTRYRELLLRQVTSPVRWDATVRTLIALGAGTFVEIGPGRMLASLGREIARTARHLGTHEALRLAEPSVAVGEMSEAALGYLVFRAFGRELT